MRFVQRSSKKKSKIICIVIRKKSCSMYAIIAWFTSGSIKFWMHRRLILDKTFIL